VGIYLREGVPAGDTGIYNVWAYMYLQRAGIYNVWAYTNRRHIGTTCGHIQRAGIYKVLAYTMFKHINIFYAVSQQPMGFVKFESTIWNPLIE
jgi:hypothetical protein